MLLGGGGSFSAGKSSLDLIRQTLIPPPGGPGKGMYTRLYTNVLNRYHAVDFCAGFHHCYADSGLFGISASVYPHFAGSIANVISHQLDSLTRPMMGGITDGELRRAKNMLKSTLVMALESRLTAVEGELADLSKRVPSDIWNRYWKTNPDTWKQSTSRRDVCQNRRSYTGCRSSQASPKSKVESLTLET